MELKHKAHHILKGRVTSITIILAFCLYAYIGIHTHKPIDWFVDRLVCLMLVYGFRKAMGFGRAGKA